MNIEQIIRNHIIQERFLGRAPADFDDDYDLLDAGVLDSLAMLNLVTYLNEQYRVEFDETDLTPEHFSSVSALSGLVRSKLT